MNIKASAEVFRKIIKGHLVNHHGDYLTAELTDSVAKIIAESLDTFICKNNDAQNKIDLSKLEVRA